MHVWSRDGTAELKGSFLCTDWDIFFADADINTAMEAITAYISFCVDSIISQKTVKYPNNKEHFTREMKECIHKERVAFRAGDNEAMKVAQRDLNKQLKEFIRKCRERAEQDPNDSPSHLKMLVRQTVVRQAKNIISDPLHVLNSEYELIRSRRRYRSADIIGTLFCSSLN